MLNLHFYILIILGCSWLFGCQTQPNTITNTSKEYKSPIKNPIEKQWIRGNWKSQTAELHIKHDSLHYFYNEDQLRGNIKGIIESINFKEGYIATRVSTASMLGSDLSQIFKGNYFLLYFDNLNASSIHIDAIKDVSMRKEQFVSYHQIEHTYKKFTKK